MAIDSLSILFCEDVRDETLGRVSLLGVFGPKIAFPTFPVQLQKLCIVLSADVVGQNSFPISATMVSPQGIALPPRMEHQVDNIEVAEWNFRVVATLVGLQINERSQIDVEFTAGDQTIKRTIKFEVGEPGEGITEKVKGGRLGEAGVHPTV